MKWKKNLVIVVTLLFIIAGCANVAEEKYDERIEKLLAESVKIRNEFEIIKKEFEAGALKNPIITEGFSGKLKENDPLDKYLPIILCVNDDDDLRIYALHSAFLAASRKNRQYILKHFDEFHSMVLKTCWAFWLLEFGPRDKRIERYIEMSKEQGWKQDILNKLITVRQGFLTQKM